MRRILHLSNTPLSNAPENLASCQRACGDQSQVLLHQKVGRNKVFVGGNSWEQIPRDQLYDLFSGADIIHFHNFTWGQAIFAQHPGLVEIAKKKRCVVQFHSSRTAHESFEDVLRDPYFFGKRLVIAQYHPREYPECEWIVPNPLPLHEPYFQRKVMKWADAPPYAISYAPSNTHLRGWDYKGHDKISPVLREFSRCGSVDIITGVPYEECLKRKSWSHIGIEEFFTGSYHLSFLEYMAFGCLPIGYLDELTKQAMRVAVGANAVESLPMEVVRDAGQLRTTLHYLLNNSEYLRQKAASAREWIHTYWSATQTTAVYDRVYNSIS